MCLAETALPIESHHPAPNEPQHVQCERIEVRRARVIFGTLAPLCSGRFVVIAWPPKKSRDAPPNIFVAAFLKLALGQVAEHLPARHKGRSPQRREIKRRAQAIGEAKEEHGWDPAAGILEREAALGHLVLLGGAADQVVHAALGVDLGFVLAGDIGQLCA